ncbi:MAG: 50S ribosomal protein L9 [Chlamydiales bacterium]|nr:50S ribosomal protein L9 [Chlamydiia bacterium]MCP5508315.1 50S ribosomal protein L9 [Chlamydiales bacterium]
MATKLLLIEDVNKLGRSGDLVSVKEGFARNFLLPKGYAVFATKQTLRKQKVLQEARALKAAEDKKAAEEQAKVLETKEIETTVKVDPEGHMYGSVTAIEIVHLAKEQHGIELEKANVALKHPIKTVGVHTIDLKLKEGVAGTIVLKIHPEGGVLPEEAKEQE